MSPDDLGGALRDLLERETEAARRLRQALANEQSALSGSDPAALDTATADKQRCVRELDVLEAERTHLCTALGHSPDADGMERLLATDTGGGLTDRWRSLLDELAACREANEKNGVLVRLQRRRVVAALGVLHQSVSGERFYGEDGEIAESAGHHLRTAI